MEYIDKDVVAVRHAKRIMDIQRVTELFIELEQFLGKYRHRDYDYFYRLLKRTIEFLTSDESDEDKKQVAIEDYGRLFGGRGSLSGFYVYSEDRGKMIILNQQFKEIRIALDKMIYADEDE